MSRERLRLSLDGDDWAIYIVDEFENARWLGSFGSVEECLRFASGCGYRVQFDLQLLA